jgi:hypothetical protein
MEIFGSIIWGVYTYRLHNLPLFVPPGHGLVYLTGLRLAETSLVSRHQRGFLAFVGVIALGWGIAGLTVLPRTDASGALGMAVFLVFLLRGRARVLYGAVFLVVAVLEISGTAAGVWAWKGTVPGLELPSGNPPSGAASGYVLFDIVAIALTARLMPLLRGHWPLPALAAPTASSVVSQADSKPSHAGDLGRPHTYARYAADLRSWPARCSSAMQERTYGRDR